MVSSTRMLALQSYAVFAVLGGSVGAALVCWFPAALLVADARGGIAAGSAWYVAATRGLLAAGLSLVCSF